MTTFDKKIKKLAQKMDIPESYERKVDKTLQEIADSKKEEPKKKQTAGKWLIRIAICVLCIGAVAVWSASNVEANIFAIFQQTLMDFLGIGGQEEAEEMGVDSDQVYVRGHRDLMLEMEEVVIDSHSIYAMVRITAPADIELEDNILFDYFCFCKGEYYSSGLLVGGSRDCKLLEVSKERPNVGIYVVSITFGEEIEEGAQMSVCFQNMTRDPYSDHPELLVEGMWSVPFFYHQTVSESIEIEGTEDMTFSYINTTAKLLEFELTPSGISMLSDVSNFPSDELGISDTTIAVRLEMLDGSELVVVSHGQGGYVQGGEISFHDEDGKTYQRDTLEFVDMINISLVSGVYIEDLYIPLIQ
ncbi:MAG: hypothetical protein K2O73_02595 [Lachnospiraceae bacterium]|nr:hypothetical protein [Lachnospiraceae bacterium]